MFTFHSFSSSIIFFSLPATWWQHSIVHSILPCHTNKQNSGKWDCPCSSAAPNWLSQCWRGMKASSWFLCHWKISTCSPPDTGFPLHASHAFIYHRCKSIPAGAKKRASSEGDNASSASECNSLASCTEGNPSRGFHSGFLWVLLPQTTERVPVSLPDLSGWLCCVGVAAGCSYRAVGKPLALYGKPFCSTCLQEPNALMKSQHLSVRTKWFSEVSRAA